jgi:hypothetical protein
MMTAELIAFPVSARIGKVRNAARSIAASRSAKEAEHRLRLALKATQRSLDVAGVPDSDTHGLCLEFMAAVDEHLMKLGSPWRLQVPANLAQPDGGQASGG